jgi:hypothetical protein
MIASIFSGIQALVNFLFLIAVLGTAGVSWWLSMKYKERFAEFPWHKAGIILGIEVLTWIAFNIAWNLMTNNLWLVAIVVIIIIVVMTKKKR